MRLNLVFTKIFAARPAASKVPRQGTDCPGGICNLADLYVRRLRLKPNVGPHFPTSRYGQRPLGRRIMPDGSGEFQRWCLVDPEGGATGGKIGHDLGEGLGP